MAKILHKRATTTHAIRTEIQRPTKSIAMLGRRYGINHKTVRKWHHRDAVEDTRVMRPTAPRSTSLTPLGEPAAVTFRQKTQLPLDDSLHSLQREMPALPRTSLHRLYQRQRISHCREIAAKSMRKSPSSVTRPATCITTSVSPHRRGQSLSVCRCGSDTQVCPCTPV